MTNPEIQGIFKLHGNHPDKENIEGKKQIITDIIEKMNELELDKVLIKLKGGIKQQ